MRLIVSLCVLALVLVEIKADGEILRAISGKVQAKKFNYRQKSGDRHNSVELSGSHAANDQDEDNNNDVDFHASDAAAHEQKSAKKKRDTSQKLQGHTHEHFNSIKERSLDETSDYINVEPMHDVVFQSSKTKSSPSPQPIHLEERNALFSGGVQHIDDERGKGMSPIARRLTRTHAGDTFVFVLCYVCSSCSPRTLIPLSCMSTREHRYQNQYSLRLWGYAKRFGVQS